MSLVCQGIKRNGTPCQRKSRTAFCYLHQDQSSPVETVSTPSLEQSTNQSPQGECGICLTEGPYQLLPCGHAAYCGPCLDNWEAQNCPLCRTPYGTDKRTHPDSTWMQALLDGFHSSGLMSLANLLRQPNDFVPIDTTTEIQQIEGRARRGLPVVQILSDSNGTSHHVFGLIMRR